MTKSKPEGKFVRNDKKKWVDRITGKEINFKKYLELKFYINGDEIDKNKTVYEIFSKHRSKIQNKYVTSALITMYSLFEGRLRRPSHRV